MLNSGKTFSILRLKWQDIPYFPITSLTRGMLRRVYGIWSCVATLGVNSGNSCHSCHYLPLNFKKHWMLSLAITLSLILRVALPFRTIFGSGAVRFADTDSYYFASGVRLLTESNPPVFPNPILYTRLLYHFTLISPFDIHIDMMIVPLALHLATMVAVYFLTQTLWGRTPAIISTIIFSLLPGEYLVRSLLGNIDYHTAEVALTTLGMLGIMLFLEASRSWRVRIGVLICGIACFTLYSQIWAGYPVFISPLAVFGVVFLLKKINRVIVTVTLIIGCSAVVLILAQRVLAFPGTTWIATAEARPIFINPLSAVPMALFIMTAIGAFVCWKDYRRTKDNKLLLLIIWSVAIMAATLLQRRFGYYLAVNTSIILGYLVFKSALAVSYRKTGLCAVVVTGVLCLIMLPGSIKIASEVTNAPSDDWVEALEWVGENTPAAANITAWWDYGYWIKYISRRNPIADPGQSPEDIKLVASILTTSNEDEVRAVDYLILDVETMGRKYSAVEAWAGRKGTDSAARRLWEGGWIEGIELIYSNDTIKVYWRKKT